ncbi:peptide chain release factor N(5)-glutamine methyltransferase [Pseudomonadota bacterium]
MAQSIKQLLNLARKKLADSPSARFDAEILMAYVLESKRSFLYANPEQELPDNRSEAFKKLIRQRAAGQPIAYLVESSEFWSLTLKVNPAVLIPRQDTERLVEAALSRIPVNSDWRIADLGTGCGAIALAIASERQKCEVHATDNSSAAIEVASENANRLNLNHVRFHCGSWAEPLKGKFHLIVSNPPYIDGDDPHLGRGDLRFEPRDALTPGADGLSAIRTISQPARLMLVEGGWLMFEHGWDQGPATRKVMQEAGFIKTETLQDLQGHDRVTIGKNFLCSGQGARR